MNRIISCSKLINLILYQPFVISACNKCHILKKYRVAHDTRDIKRRDFKCKIGLYR